MFPVPMTIPALLLARSRTVFNSPSSASDLVGKKADVEGVEHSYSSKATIFGDH